VQELGQDAKKSLSCGNTYLHASWIPVLSSAGRADLAGIEAMDMPLTWGYITKWSYGDSNSGPLTGK
jgi:hypothetical protein